MASHVARAWSPSQGLSGTGYDDGGYEFQFARSSLANPPAATAITRTSRQMIYPLSGFVRIFPTYLCISKADRSSDKIAYRISVSFSETINGVLASEVPYCRKGSRSLAAGVFMTSGPGVCDAIPPANVIAKIDKDDKRVDGGWDPEPDLPELVLSSPWSQMDAGWSCVFLVHRNDARFE